MTLQEAWKMSFVEFHDVSKFYTMGSTQIKAADKVNFTIGHDRAGGVLRHRGAERRGQNDRSEHARRHG